MKFSFTILKNRYLITLVLFLAWLVFIDNNNLVERYKMLQENKKLIENRNEYKKKIIETRNGTKALEQKEYVEKIGREKYMMKKENEDIYIVTE